LSPLSYGKAKERIITHINFREVKKIPDVIKNILQNSKGNSRKLMMVGDGPEKKKQSIYVKS
jgi:hypothetical protein